MKNAPARVTATATGGVPLAMNQLSPPNMTHADPRRAVFLADILLLGNRRPVGEEPGSLREERPRGGASSCEGRVAFRSASAVCRTCAEKAAWDSVRSSGLECGTIENVAYLRK